MTQRLKTSRAIQAVMLIDFVGDSEMILARRLRFLVHSHQYLAHGGFRCV